MLSDCEENSVLTDNSMKVSSDDTKFLVSPISEVVAPHESRSAPPKLNQKDSLRQKDSDCSNNSGLVLQRITN